MEVKLLLLWKDILVKCAHPLKVKLVIQGIPAGNSIFVRLVLLKALSPIDCNNDVLENFIDDKLAQFSNADAEILTSDDGNSTPASAVALKAL